MQKDKDFHQEPQPKEYTCVGCKFDNDTHQFGTKEHPSQPTESITACCYESKKRGIACSHRPQTTENNWEQEFDKTFPYSRHTSDIYPREEIKSFISKVEKDAIERVKRNRKIDENIVADTYVQAIEMSKQGWIDEGRIEERQRILEVIEGMKRDCGCYEVCTCDSYNQALDEVINKIKK